MQRIFLFLQALAYCYSAHGAIVQSSGRHLRSSNVERRDEPKASSREAGDPLMKGLSVQEPNGHEVVAEAAGVTTPPPVERPEDAPFAFWKSYGSMLSVNPLATTASIVTPLLFTLLLACCYRQFHGDPPPVLAGLDEEHTPELLDEGKWRYALFGCDSAPRLACFLACCCPALRWADTMRLAGVYSFFTGVCVFALLSSLFHLTAGVSGLILLCVFTLKRQKIRSLFALPHGTVLSYLEDCCTYCLCSCCAIIQEARQIEEAYYVQHKVVTEIPNLKLRG